MEVSLIFQKIHMYSFHIFKIIIIIYCTKNQNFLLVKIYHCVIIEDSKESLEVHRDDYRQA